MTLRPGSPVILSHGPHVVRLLPTLRAGATLAALPGGLPGLLTRLGQLDTASLRAVIHAAADPDKAHAFLQVVAELPLARLRATILPGCLDLVGAIMSPARVSDDTWSQRTPAPARPSLGWGDLFDQLYRFGTGWLGWTPAATWNATIPELIAATEGLSAKLSAIHGGEDKGGTASPRQTEEERQANIAAGLDPDFERGALARLKGKIADASR